MRFLVTEIESVTSENVGAKARGRELEETLSQQDGRCKVEIKAIIARRTIYLPATMNTRLRLRTCKVSLERSKRPFSRENDQF